MDKGVPWTPREHANSEQDEYPANGKSVQGTGKMHRNPAGEPKVCGKVEKPRKSGGTFPLFHRQHC